MTCKIQSNTMTCNACNRTIYDRQMSKTSPDNKIWHSNCLKCCECNRLLDSKYFETGGRLYCTSDYLSNYGPSCSGCGSKINDEQYFFSVRSSSATIIDATENTSSMQSATTQSHASNDGNDNDSNGARTNNDNSNSNDNISCTNSTTTACSLFFHDKCFLCNYCARPLLKGERYCMLDNQNSAPTQKSQLVCHDICALKYHSSRFNNTNSNTNNTQSDNQVTQPKVRARRGRMKQNRPA